MRFLTALVIACQLPVSAYADELRLAVIANNATHEGLWSVVEEAARRAGLTVSAHAMPAERGMLQASQYDLDGAAGRTTVMAQGYPALVRVDEPVYQYAPTAYTYRRFDVTAGWQALAGHTVCIRRGLKLTEERTRGLPRQELRDESSMLRMLRAGGCDVAVMDRHNAVAKAAMAADARLLQLQPPLERIPLYLYLNDHHAHQAPRLAEALRKMRADGAMQRLGSE
ncbi:hypothetical protein GCM10027277_48760 [Pseudoduganella ginsengisoli]|uniref:Transporter substrate-binding domain-containing protein n=1 Tax=Pseudoduganella ginsengisoli TaxID=1462440 RepID=A0A6L6Q4X1_9BURK|nr:transporter substrate-binding domain-containing protein [Pseudoduganella ginsengisoli]MTW04499.1 transporter substrate-binding domain-containing protein [Pseudoduganella ginsengisoli]